MQNPVRGTRFRRDVNLAKKRGKDMAKLREVTRVLLAVIAKHPETVEEVLKAC